MMAFPLKQRLALPSFGLLGALVLCLAMLGAIVVSPYFPFKGSVGFNVSTIRDSAEIAGDGEVFIVRIGGNNRFFLDSREVALEELTSAVNKALGRRTERVILIDADPNVEYGEVLQAIDCLNGQHVNVVLTFAASRH
jgi:biopolymer transport protein ExbD